MEAIAVRPRSRLFLEPFKERKEEDRAYREQQQVKETTLREAGVEQRDSLKKEEERQVMSTEARHQEGSR